MRYRATQFWVNTAIAAGPSGELGRHMAHYGKRRWRGTERDQVFWFAIKPGGFGDAQTWGRAWDALQGRG